MLSLTNKKVNQEEYNCQHDAVEKKFVQANMILFQNYKLSLVKGFTYKLSVIDLLAEGTFSTHPQFILWLH